MVNINLDNPTSLGDIPENPQHRSPQDKDSPHRTFSASIHVTYKHICNIAVRNLKYLDSIVITAGIMFIVHIKPPAMLESKLLMLCNLTFDA